MTTATHTASQHTAGISELGIPVETGEFWTASEQAVRSLGA